ncbi:UNVERIFIED_CONTAM: hypothetical protein FKN15_030390 [Acipenser sinensis]
MVCCRMRVTLGMYDLPWPLCKANRSGAFSAASWVWSNTLPGFSKGIAFLGALGTEPSATGLDLITGPYNFLSSSAKLVGVCELTFDDTTECTKEEYFSWSTHPYRLFFRVFQKHEVDKHTTGTDLSCCNNPVMSLLGPPYCTV